jgi:hypothetical protein
MVMVMPALSFLLTIKTVIMQELDPIWDEGEYPVEEINPSADNLNDALGIPEERSLEIRILAMKSLLKHKNIHKAMVDVSEICVHPNELAYGNYVIGAEVTFLKQVGKIYEEKMNAMIEQMEAKLRGEDKQEKSLDDVDLNFPEEEEEKEEPLVFDDEN